MKLFCRYLGLCVLIATLSGCFFRPYHIEIQQGIKLTPQMIKQIKPGMTQSQVLYILGTPNIQDPFHHDRWDYIETVQQNHGPMTQRRFTVFFDGKKVTRIGGTYAPPQPLEYKLVKADN